MFLEDLELDMRYIFNKIFKRDQISIGIHTAEKNKPQLRDQITKFVGDLEKSYHST